MWRACVVRADLTAIASVVAAVSVSVSMYLAADAAPVTCIHTGIALLDPSFPQQFPRATRQHR